MIGPHPSESLALGEPGDDALLDDLNEAQRSAVTHGPGPLLVLAGAGTGKTRVLTRRIAWLIASRNARPSEILGLTFTEKAAQEMEERVDVLVPFGFVDATLATFHSFAHRILSEFGLALGLSDEPRVLTEAETVVFLRERLFEMPLERWRPLADPTRFLRALVQHMGRLRDEDISPEAYAAHANALLESSADDPVQRERAGGHVELAACYRAYVDLLDRHDFLDFAGLIARTLDLLREHPDVLETLRERYRWILIDEFQDTNRAQFELVRLLGGPQPNLTVVGDDDQSIYKFRGAAISNILGFREAYPDASQVVLTDNYRSTQAILDVAYRLVRHNDPDRLEVKSGIDKRLRARARLRPTSAGLEGLPLVGFDRLGRERSPSTRLPVETHGFDSESSEADFVAERIAADVQAGRRRYGDFAVLVRSRGAADPVLRALNLRGIPHRFSSGSGLFDRPEVAAALDALRVIADPGESRAFFYLAASEIYGVPAFDLSSLAGEARRRHRPLELVAREALREALLEDGAESTSDPARSRTELSSGARETLARLVADLDELRPFAVSRATGEVLYRFLTQSEYLTRLTSDSNPANDEKVQNLALLFDRTRAYSRIAARDRVLPFVEHIDLLFEAGENPPTTEAGIDADAVHVLTVHKAKGLEFPVVLLVGLEAGRFPARRQGDPLPFPVELMRQELPEGDYQLQEERRLCYVAMTRAAEELVLTWARDCGGKRAWKASPFLLEALDVPTLASVERSTAAETLHRNASPPERSASEHWVRDRSASGAATDPAVAPPPLPEDRLLTVAPGHVDDWLTCPLKYKYAHVLRVPLRAHHALAYGSALRSAVRYYYRRALEGSPPPASELVALFEREWSGEGFVTREHEERRFTEGRLALESFWQRERERPSQPTAIDREYELRTGTTLLRGRLDRVDVRPEGTVLVGIKSSDVRDPEAADARARQNLPLELGALAWGEVAGRPPAAVELHYVASGLVGRAAVTEATLAEAAGKLTEAARGIRERRYTPTPGYRACGYCPYNAVCPSRARGPY